MIDQPFNSITYNRKGPLSSVVLFWLGFSLYFIFQICSLLDFLNTTISLGFQFLGLVILIYSAVNILTFRFSNYYLKTLFILYFSWLLFVILRDSTALLNFTSIKNFLLSAFSDGGLFYFVPLTLFLPKNSAFYKTTFDIIFILGIVYVLFDIILIKSLIIAGDNPKSQEIFEILSGLSLPCGFILCTYPYHSKFKNLVALGVILLTLGFALIRARRGLLFFSSSICIAAYLIYFFHSRKRYFLLYFTLLLISVGSLYASNLYHIRENRILGFITQKGDEDTRTGIELYFYDDMKTKDWIIGKGMLGQYFCPDIEENQLTNFRNVIETGYLQLILKGGLISLVLLLLIATPGFIMGILFSKNILAKACGAWILIFIGCLYPRDVVKFDLNYLLFWISIGVCYDKNLRNIPEKKMIEYLKKVKKNNLAIS